MDHQVIGTVLAVLEMKLEPGESDVAESGERSWMTESIQLETAAIGKTGARGWSAREAGRRGVQLLHDRVRSPGLPEPESADSEARASSAGGSTTPDRRLTADPRHRHG